VQWWACGDVETTRDIVQEKLIGGIAAISASMIPGHLIRITPAAHAACPARSNGCGETRQAGSRRS
jgi:hypothetical protein